MRTLITFYSPIQRRHLARAAITLGDDDFLDVPERLDSILAALDESHLSPIVPPPEIGALPFPAVHDAGMLHYLATAFQRHRTEEGDAAAEHVLASEFPPPRQRRRPRTIEGLKGLYCTDVYTPIDEHTWEAAAAAARCALAGSAALLRGELLVYALCRPPGHHAGPDFFGGYCYLNNAALAARWITERGIRVAVLDLDYHHGNGTQAIFYADPAVWYGSLHVDPEVEYPYFAGYADEVGVGPGEGLNLNVPLPPGTGESAYLAALDAVLDRIDRFDPGAIVLSAGFDTYVGDPMGTFRLSTGSFGKVGQRVGALRRPTLVVQEGGYHPPDLGENVVALLEGVGGADGR